MVDPARWPDVVRRVLGAPPGRVAFDMDGTLVEGDVGEGVLRDRLAAGADLPGLRALLGAGDLWAAYERALVEGPPERDHFACALGAEGLTPPAVAEMARAQLERGDARPRPTVIALARALRAAGHELWIVTGSLTAAAIEVPRFIGLEVDGVLGQEVDIVDGRLTAVRRGPVLCKGGKVAAWDARHATPPLLMVGDTPNDLPMMAHAIHGGLGVPRPGGALVAAARAAGVPVVVDID